jgi:flavin reductase (DIM6/NTAB) family NADH-FMN oxidoreductase RutF
MEITLADLAPRQRYLLLVNLVLPRPIALVTTNAPDGTPNAAPYAFFQLLGEDPPLVILSIDARDHDRAVRKDTALNIAAQGEFVVNLVSEAILPAAHVCSIEFPAGTDETEAAGFTLAPSALVKPPRIAESPANLECREWRTIPVGERGRTLVLGEVLHVHLRDDVVIEDAARKEGQAPAIDLDRLGLVGRLHAAGWYARLTDRFQLPRITLDEWRRDGLAAMTKTETPGR